MVVIGNGVGGGDGGGDGGGSAGDQPHPSMLHAELIPMPVCCPPTGTFYAPFRRTKPYAAHLRTESMPLRSCTQLYTPIFLLP